MPVEVESFEAILTRAGDISGLLKILLREVEGRSNTREAHNTGWRWIDECDDLVLFRMALFVDKLFENRTWWKGLELVYVDLSLFDHDNDPKDLRLTWTIGHRLGIERKDWAPFLKIYREYVEKNGTSVLRRDYLLGLSRLPEPNLVSVASDFEPADKHAVLQPSVHSIGAAAMQPGGEPKDYLTNVILKDRLGGGAIKHFVQYHFQAGLEDRPAEDAEVRDACSANLYLTFLDEKGTQGKDDQVFGAAKEVIQDQLMRITGLYLLEKSKVLRRIVESAQIREKGRSENMRIEVTDLLEKLKQVEHSAQVLRQSLVGPLARYINWVNVQLPKLFDGTTGSIRGRWPTSLPNIAASHNVESWTKAHLATAFWFLCEPRWAALGEKVDPGNLMDRKHWEQILEEATHADEGDPWFFCAHACSKVTEAGVKNLAAVLKRMQRKRKDEGSAWIDRSILEFLLGIEITIPSDAKTEGFYVDKPWLESTFVGLPRLAKLAGPFNFLRFDPAMPSVLLGWPLRSGLTGGSRLIESVSERMNEIIAVAGRKDGVSGSAGFQSVSEVLDEFTGKNDLSSAVVRVMLPDGRMDKLKVSQSETGVELTFRGKENSTPMSAIRSDGEQFHLIIQPNPENTV